MKLLEEDSTKTNSWEIEGSTIIEGSEVYLDAEGDLQSAAGSADIEDMVKYTLMLFKRQWILHSDKFRKIIY